MTTTGQAADTSKEEAGGGQPATDRVQSSQAQILGPRRSLPKDKTAQPVINGSLRRSSFPASIKPGSVQRQVATKQVRILSDSPEIYDVIPLGPEVAEYRGRKGFNVDRQGTSSTVSSGPSVKTPELNASIPAVQPAAYPLILITYHVHDDHREPTPPPSIVIGLSEDSTHDTTPGVSAADVASYEKMERRARRA